MTTFDVATPHFSPTSGGYLKRHAVRGKSPGGHAFFSHPKVGDLTLFVNPDEITWAYGLNTQNYPTYGGEVVQILSMYFDDMTISGTVRAYRDAEDIYEWFLEYAQIATQGNQGTGSFDPDPVVFSYAPRGWQFSIWPKAFPSFKYGTEVVAPTYTIVAAVAEDKTLDLTSAIIDQASALATEAKIGDFDTFGKATAAIGYQEDNPWSEPFVVTGDKFQPETDPKADNQQLADFFNKLIPSYLEGDFTDLRASKPPKTTGKPGEGTGTTTTPGTTPTQPTTPGTTPDGGNTQNGGTGNNRWLPVMMATLLT